MLAFQRAGQAIKARLGTATLVRALTAASLIAYPQTQHRDIHDKIPHENEAIKQAKPATESLEGSTEASTRKVAESTDVAAAVFGRNDGLPGDEFWRKVPIWRDVNLETFISYRWTVR